MHFRFSVQCSVLCRYISCCLCNKRHKMDNYCISHRIPRVCYYYTTVSVECVFGMLIAVWAVCMNSLFDRNNSKSVFCRHIICYIIHPKGASLVNPMVVRPSVHPSVSSFVFALYVLNRMNY